MARRDDLIPFAETHGLCLITIEQILEHVSNLSQVSPL